MTDDLHPVQIDILRRMTPDQRFAQGLRFLRMTREWLAAGVRPREVLAVRDGAGNQR